MRAGAFFSRVVEGCVFLAEIRDREACTSGVGRSSARFPERNPLRRRATTPGVTRKSRAPLESPRRSLKLDVCLEAEHRILSASPRVLEAGPRLPSTRHRRHETEHPLGTPPPQRLERQHHRLEATPRRRSSTRLDLEAE